MEDHASQDQAFLTTNEVARLLRVRPGTLRRWVRDGVIPVVRIKPKVMRFDASAVRRALADRKGVARAK